MAAYCILGRKPISLQAGSRSRMKTYREHVLSALRTTDSVPYAGPVYVRCTWFHAGPADLCDGPDVDNLAKPILDALKGEAFVDDHQVMRLTTCRHSHDAAMTGVDELPHQVADRLIDMARRNYADVLFVEIGETAPEPAVFGPVDGVSA